MLRAVCTRRRGLRLLEELLAHPERSCIPNVLIHAGAGMGKTMLATKFRRDYPPSFDAACGVTAPPVIFVEMPPAPDEGKLYTRLPDSVAAPIEPRATLARKKATALHILPQLRPGMLMIDKVQHLLSGSYRQQRQAPNLIKSLGNHSH